MVKTIDSIAFNKMKNDFSAKTALIMLDGFGISHSFLANAIELAKPAFFNSLWRQEKRQILVANKDKETAYQSIFAGQMTLTRREAIAIALNNSQFVNFSLFVNLFLNAQKEKRNIHLIGVLSDNNLFDLEILAGFLKIAKIHNFENLCLHLIFENNGSDLIESLMVKLREFHFRNIVSIVGSFYLTEKNKRKLIIDLTTKGLGEKANNLIEALQFNRQEGFEDEFILPTKLSITGLIEPRDTVLTFNFENNLIPDLINDLPKFLELDIFQNWQKNFTSNITNNLSEILNQYHKTYLKVFENNWEGGLKQEPDFLQIEVKSAWEMAYKTGDIIKAQKAVLKVDEELKKMVRELKKKNYQILIAGSFGFLEEMNLEKSYSQNPVPLIFLPTEETEVMSLMKNDSQIFSDFSLNPHSLADIAPTILAIFKINQPVSMSGQNLLTNLK